MNIKREKIHMYVSAFTIGLPFTLVGLLVLLVLVIFVKNRLNIIVVRGRIGVTVADTYFGGVSLGIVYLVSSSNRLETHCHEIGHTVQFKWLGILFIPIVALPSVIRYYWRDLKIVKKHFKLRPYDAAWYEGQATDIGMFNFYDDVKEKLGASQ